MMEFPIPKDINKPALLICLVELFEAYIEGSFLQEVFAFAPARYIEAPKVSEHLQPNSRIDIP